MHESFRNAFRPQSRHVCLRLPIKPLTLGHLWYLQGIDSPVLSHDGPKAFGDILVAVLVCAQPHEDAEKMFKPGRFRSIWLEVFARYWGWRCRKLDLIQEGAKFKAYLDQEQAGMPPLEKPKDGTAKSIGAPWEWVLRDFLCPVYGMTKREALNTPVVEANTLWAVHRDWEGRVSLATASSSSESLIKGIWRRRREAEAARQN